MIARRLILVGATATGKSDVALALARRNPAVEIVNADSRQVLRGLHVGTAAPDAASRATAPHHLFDVRDPGAAFSVATWLGLAEVALAEIAARGHRAVVVGGTGLYINALVNGLDITAASDPGRRSQRNTVAAAPGGIEMLLAELMARDPEAPAMIDIKNPRRIIRALEILDSTSAGLRDAWQSAAAGATALDPADRFVGLSLEPAVHQSRLVARTKNLFVSGALQAEVDAALASGIDAATLSASGIGYAEALALRAGTLSLDEAVEATIRRTRRYAKAQATFFRRDQRIIWVDAADGDRCVAAIADLTGW